MNMAIGLVVINTQDVFTVPVSALPTLMRSLHFDSHYHCSLPAAKQAF